MTTTTIPTTAAPTTATVPAHIRANRVTKSLLGYGVLAGPFYVTVSLAQALTRDGFDLDRHAWSLLANGGLGWIQITNFVITGLMVIAAAVGLHRALPGTVWAGRLTAVYGASLIAAGAMRADPAMGFPTGTPEGPGTVSWHGLGHLAAGGIGFLGIIVACFVVARRFGRDGRRGWAGYSRISGALFLVGFAGIASGNSAPALTLGFVAAVIVIWTWLAAVSANLYRALPGC